MLENLSHSPHVIFATAHDAYAIKAFEVHAIDYLLKPVSGSRLGEALRRVRERVDTQPPPDWNDVLSTLRSEARRFPEQIPVHKGKQILLLPVDEVYWFEVNCRFGGGAPLSIAAGAELPLYLLQDLLGVEITTDGKFRENLMMLRYPAAVFRPVDDATILPGYDTPFFR